MRKIIIKNFGPVKNIELDISKTMNIVIGPQASGKSTIAKTIYFCRKIRDYLIEYLIDSNNFSNTHPNELFVNFLKFVRKNFMGFLAQQNIEHLSILNISMMIPQKDTFI